MADELDIYRTANARVELHGDDAPIQAAMKADALLEADDIDGQAVWKRLLGFQDCAPEGSFDIVGRVCWVFRF